MIFSLPSRKNFIQFFTTFICGSAFAFILLKLKKYSKKRKLIYGEVIKKKSKTEVNFLYDAKEQELVREQLKRNYEFFNEEGMNLIKNSFVCVVGIGGVGRYNYNIKLAT
jgi:hypothetical protein